MCPTSADPTAADSSVVGAPTVGGPFTGFLDELAGDPRVVHIAHHPPADARHGSLTPPLDPALAAALGVERLWSHQVEAINLVRSGRSVVVTTGTGSGKSVCYQAPIAESVIGGGTALLVFPTKALARDQLLSFTSMGVDALTAAAYDGDCTPEERRWVRSRANVVLTNPEMLHAGILPRHEMWAHLLGRLTHVVIDELHVLRGLFGSHVAHILRRLRRLCDHYGAEPTFVFTSATIGDPATLAGDLCGLDVTEVSDDGSPRGARTLVLWNPLTDDADTPDSEDAPEGTGDPGDPDDPDEGPPGWTAGERRRSSARDAALVTRLLLTGGHRTLTFCRGRRGTELLAAEVRRRLPADLAESVQPYRGGLLPAERRTVEDALAAGRLRAVVATTALELGIDVGGLDAVVLNGFPGTVASMRQQAGRAGRAGRDGLAVLVAGDDQLDQWYMAHPDDVLQRSPEPGVVNPANPFVLTDQLACAAHELPLGAADHEWWPDLLDEGVRLLAHEGRVVIRPRHRLRPGGPVAVWSGVGVPAPTVGLRTSAGGELGITTADGELIGTIDAARAPRQTHPGAIYLHRGRPWRVVSLDIANAEVVVEPAADGEHTRARTTTDISVEDVDRTGSLGAVALACGPVVVRTRVTGYQRIETRTGRTIATEELDLPDQVLETRAFWFTVPPDVLTSAGVVPASLPGTLHAAEHAAIGMLPLFAICDRSDVGGVSTALHPDTGMPTVFIHDAHPGGAGLAELAFDAAHRLVSATAELVGACSCAAGCPSCVQSPKCGNGNEPLDKDGATRLLTAIAAGASVTGGSGGGPQRAGTLSDPDDAA
jgi:DEAD/DEAH box helicase domain-containing protein